VASPQPEGDGSIVTLPYPVLSFGQADVECQLAEEANVAL
jgi:hypothetical protein